MKSPGSGLFPTLSASSWGACLVLMAQDGCWNLAIVLKFQPLWRRLEIGKDAPPIRNIGSQSGTYHCHFPLSRTW